MDKINHYVAKMTFLGLAMFPWKRLKKAKKVNWKIKFQSIHPKNWNLVLQNIS